MDKTNADQAGATDTRDVLARLRDYLHTRGVDATGPFPGWPSPQWDYLELPATGEHVHVEHDRNGCWQALIYAGEGKTRARLVRMASADGADWPGDPV